MSIVAKGGLEAPVDRNKRELYSMRQKLTFG